MHIDLKSRIPLSHLNYYSMQSFTYNIFLMLWKIVWKNVFEIIWMFSFISVSELQKQPKHWKNIRWLSKQLFTSCFMNKRMMNDGKNNQKWGISHWNYAKYFVASLPLLLPHLISFYNGCTLEECMIMALAVYWIYLFETIKLRKSTMAS